MAGIFNSLFRLRYGSVMKKFEGIPGPTPIFPIGNMSEFAKRNPWEVFVDYEKQYGGMTLCWLGGEPTLVLNDPNLISEVLITKADDYYKDYPIKALRPVLRNTVFNLNSPEWDKLRKPHSHPCLIEGLDSWLESQFPVVKSVVDRHLSRMLETAGEIEILDKIQRLFFDAFNSIVCGPQFQAGGYENYYKMTVVATRRMATPQALLIPPLDPAFHSAMSAHYGSYTKVVKEARQNPDPAANDLLSIFLRQGSEIPDEQLVDFLSEFHVGGDVSSAAGIVNTFQLLNENPEIEKKLYSELAEMRRRKPDYDLSSIGESTLLDHVLRESLRLNPPVQVFGRNVRKDKTTTLGGRELPPNTAVMIVAKAVQRSADHWKNPDQFDPDRWANGGVEANPIGSDYFFPFGRGPRMCVGWKIAMFSMKIVLASMLSKVYVKTSGSFKPSLHCGVVETKELKAQLVPHQA